MIEELAGTERRLQRAVSATLAAEAQSGDGRPVTAVGRAAGEIRRRDRLGGLIHEYHRAAA